MPFYSIAVTKAVNPELYTCSSFKQKQLFLSKLQEESAEKKKISKYPLELTRPKMAEDLTSPWPWALLYTRYNMPANWHAHQLQDS